MSKSELKRLCTLKPLEMADRLYELEARITDCKQALGEHEDTDLNIAERITQLRNEGRGYFHQYTEEYNKRLNAEADIWKQVIMEWEKPWGLSNGESFETRMRRRAGK